MSEKNLTIADQVRLFNNQELPFDVPGVDPEITKVLNPEYPISKERICIKDPDTGLTYAGLFYNKENLGQITPLVASPEWNICLKHKPEVYMFDQIAIDGRPLIVLENPSTGASSNLTYVQNTILKKSKYPFSGVARSMYKALESLDLEGDQYDFFGYSMGSCVVSQLALEFIEHGSSVRNITLVEPLGVVDMRIRELGKRFLSDLGMLGFYEDDPHNVDQRKASGVGEMPLKKNAKLMTKWLSSSRRRGVFTGYLQAMSYRFMPGLLYNIKSFSEDTNITIIHGGESKVSPSKDIPNLYGDVEIRHIILPGDSHSFGERGKRVAGLLRLVERTQ